VSTSKIQATEGMSIEKYKMGVWVATSLSRTDAGAPDRLSNPKIWTVGMLTEEHLQFLQMKHTTEWAKIPWTFKM
jgi:hypothetical protein